MQLSTMEQINLFDHLRVLEHSEHFYWCVSYRINPCCGKRKKGYFKFSDYRDALNFFISCSIKGLNPKFDYVHVSQ